MPRGICSGMLRDMGRSSDDPNTRIYQTRERQTFHTDSCDVVGLLCLQAAKSGGLSSLVSSTTIFNEMQRRRPDLLRVLMEPIETDRRGEIPEGGKPYFNIPVFNYHSGLVSTIYQRQYIESARRFPGVAPLTSLQIEALNLFDELANDPQLTLTMELQPGDIQLVHNHTILHDRTAFEDYPEPERKRHLVAVVAGSAGCAPATGSLCRAVWLDHTRRSRWRCCARIETHDSFRLVHRLRRLNRCLKVRRCESMPTRSTRR